MHDGQIKDKALYAVALLAAFLAFSTFKDEMAHIFVPIGNHSYSLLGLMLFFVCLLTLSVYLYGLEYIRYSFPKYQNFFLLQLIVPAANFIYTVAIIFPLFIFIFWLSSITPLYSFIQSHQTSAALSEVLAAGIGAVFSFWNSYRLRKQLIKEESEAIEQERSHYLKEAVALYNGQFYGASILEAFKALDSYMRERLLERKGLTTENLPFSIVTELAIKHGLLEKKYLPQIRELRTIRNKAAHSSLPFTERQARSALTLVNEIFEREIDD